MNELVPNVAYGCDTFGTFGFKPAPIACNTPYHGVLSFIILQKVINMNLIQ